MVGDKPGLHQHRGNIRRFQHRQTGVFRRLLVQSGNLAHGTQDLAANVIPFGTGLVHGEVEEGLRQIGVGIGFRQHLADTAQQLALLLLLLQPAAHLAVGTVGREDPDRGAARGRVMKTVCMDRDQQIRLGLAGNLGALVEVDEVVATTGHHGAHPRFTVDQCRQLLGDRQRDPLLVGTTRADGARVFPAVARVDGNHHPLALATDRRGLHCCRRALLFIREVDDQTMAIRPGWRQRKDHRLDGGAEIHHQSQTPLLQRCALADLAHQFAVVLDPGQIGGVARPFQIDYQPIRAGEGEVVVIGGAAHIEHHPGVIR